VVIVIPGHTKASTPIRIAVAVAYLKLSMLYK